MRLERLAETCGGTAVEVFVHQDCRPHRHPYRAFGHESRCRWGRHDTRAMRPATPLVVTLPVDTTHMRLDLDFNAGGYCGGRKRVGTLPHRLGSISPLGSGLGLRRRREGWHGHGGRAPDCRAVGPAYEG